MNLQRDFADAQLGRSLFVQQAAYDERQHLTFAWRQAGKAPLQIGQLCVVPPGQAILRERRIDRSHQSASLSGFVRKSTAPDLIARTEAGIVPCPVMKTIVG